MQDNEEKYHDINKKLEILRRKLREDMNNEIEIDKPTKIKIIKSKYYKKMINNSHIVLNYFRNFSIKYSKILQKNVLLYLPLFFDFMKICARHFINYLTILYGILLLYLPKSLDVVQFLIRHFINYSKILYEYSSLYLLILYGFMLVCIRHVINFLWLCIKYMCGFYPTFLLCYWMTVFFIFIFVWWVLKQLVNI